MSKPSLLASSLLLLVLLVNSFHLNAQTNYDYPIAPKDSVYDQYFDTLIYDPYQWMENPEDPRLAEWLEEQGKITKKLSRKHTDEWTMRQQLGALYHSVKQEVLYEYVEEDDKDRYKYEFDYEYRTAKRSADLRYREKGSSVYRNLVDIKEFQRENEDNISIQYFKVNKEKDLIAVAISRNGTDWQEVYFYDLKTSRQLPDTLLYLRNSSNMVWHGNGLYYDRYKKPEEGRELLDKAVEQRVMFHVVGTPQQEDRLLYQNPDTTGTNIIRFRKIGKDKEEKLIFNTFYQVRGKIYKALAYVDLDQESSFILKNFLITPDDKNVNFDPEVIHNTNILINTTWNAPNGKVITADINQQNKLTELVPESDAILRSVNPLGKDKFVCIYRKEGVFKAMIYNYNGQLLKGIDFPKGKKVKFLFEENPEAKYTDFALSSFYHPDLWYQLNLETLSFQPSVELTLPYDPADLETRYVKFNSKDGTEIPMYITCRKDLVLDGTNPTLLYGYGGYGITVEPKFDETEALWLLHGGVLAVPNIRGGGAQGDFWGKEGRRMKKQNAIDDFISAAEYLIHEKYTNPGKLAIKGKSHGGLLVAATVTQCPELFKTAIAEAGVYDMLRFEKYTIGSVAINRNEFGTIKFQEEFNNLLSYSPLHKIKKGVKYPNMLLITGDHDDRVPPWHTYKFLATLQESSSSETFHHMYQIPGAGHGGALSPEEWVNKTLYENNYLFGQMGIDL